MYGSMILSISLHNHDGHTHMLTSFLQSRVYINHWNTHTAIQLPTDYIDSNKVNLSSVSEDVSINYQLKHINLKLSPI